MHDVSIRHNRHDRNVAPLVSIGLSYIDRLPVPVEPRTAAQILADRYAANGAVSVGGWSNATLFSCSPKLGSGNANRFRFWKTKTVSDLPSRISASTPAYQGIEGSRGERAWRSDGGPTLQS
jgi:hypothetical protein